MTEFKGGQLRFWVGDVCQMISKAVAIFRNFGVKIMENKWMILLLIFHSWSFYLFIYLCCWCLPSMSWQSGVLKETFSKTLGWTQSEMVRSGFWYVSNVRTFGMFWRIKRIKERGGSSYCAVGSFPILLCFSAVCLVFSASICHASFAKIRFYKFLCEDVPEILLHFWSDGVL